MTEPSPSVPSGARAAAHGSETHLPTVRVAQVIGLGDRPTTDPTEDYHEASRTYPGVVDPTATQGAARLERSVEMRISASRSVKRYAHRPPLRLPSPDLGSARLADTIAGRRSARVYGTRPLALRELSTLLDAGYGVTGQVAGTTQSLRAVPSGGALYPLELYVACRRVDGTEPALYHYDPLRRVLEHLRGLAPADELGPLTPYGELLAPSAAVIAMTAVFWRSRFKYGARAYRFALLEAGHVAQNVLLAAAALGLRALPVGGFYDRRVDALLGIDGIHEAALYLLPLGSAT